MVLDGFISMPRFVREDRERMTDRKVEEAAKALMLALQGGYELNPEKDEETRACYEKYRRAARAAIAALEG